MTSLKILLAGLLIGGASIVLDRLVMGLLFRNYMPQTPDASPQGERKNNIMKILVSLYFGFAIMWFYSIIMYDLSSAPGHIGIASSVGIGTVCWTVFALPVILSTGTSTSWHPMASLGVCINSALKVLTAALVAVLVF